MADQPITVARNAMATRFEIALFGDDPVALRAAADEALDEVQRVDFMLGWRNPASPIAHLNARASSEAVRVNPELFNLLKRCREYHEAGNGAFDITVGPLMRALGFHAVDGRQADAETMAAARAACGMRHVELNEKDGTVRFARPGIRLDFGAIGKGYALELAAEILRDSGVTSALIHGGTSSVCAIGHPPDELAWKIAVEYPPGDTADQPLPVLTVLELRDNSMSVSAVWGRVFQVGTDTFGHVIDPRTGTPANRALLGIFVTESAAESDALSTALLTDGLPGVDYFKKVRPNGRTLALATDPANAGYTIASHGIEWRPLPDGKSQIAARTGPS